MSGITGPFRLDERVMIITGGAGFLGAAYAHHLASAGARIVISDIDGEAAGKLAKDVTQETGAEALGLPTDVSDPGSVRSMVNRTLERFGKVDGLVNNAAIDPKFDRHHAQEHQNGFEDFPLDLWERSLKVNITGPFLCTQAVAPHMLAKRRGVVVNISSTYGLVGPDQRLYQEEDSCGPRRYKPVTYSVTKSSMLGLTKYLAAYWAGKNIRVNTLTLGGIFHDHDPEFVNRYSCRTPLGRMGFPCEAAYAVNFLLSDASSYMTGSNLIVDGGWTSW